MLREILKRTDPRLRLVSDPVGEVTDAVRELVADLFQTMRYGERLAIGLAAPQIGVFKRVFVMEDLARGPVGRLACIDPVILESADIVSVLEGCLSFESAETVFVERASRVTLEYTELSGKRRTKKLQGLVAVCAQHELDHLNGRLMSDYGAVVINGEEDA